MKVYDCFMFFDEELVLDIRLNILDKYIDYFVIVESKYNHKGEKRNLKFDINKFYKFKNKIKYLIHDNLPSNIEKIEKTDSQNLIELKSSRNAAKRENCQRNFILKGLLDANQEDIILVSDLDEIPNLSLIDLKNLKTKITVFEQNFFYYKFDLYIPNFIWYGTKVIKMKDFISPQWARNIKCKKYPKYRIDILFNNTKFNNIEIIKNGGWHFSNIKTPEEIEVKYKSYLHHFEYEKSLLNLDEIKNFIKNKRAIYDLTADKYEDKMGNGAYLKRFEQSLLPKFIQDNKKKFIKWFDQN